MTWKIGQKLVHAKLGAGLFDGTAVAFGQAHREHLGWTAVPEPAPVERTLGCHPRCGTITAAEYDADDSLHGGRWCKANVDTWSDDTPLFCAADCSRREARERALASPKVEPPAPAKPAPVVEAPRCEYRKGAHDGVPVLRVMFHGGGPKRMYACDACYLYSEDFPDRSADDPSSVTKPRPATPPGLVPQSFGDERIGGVWASRGMRIAAGSLPPRPSCPMHPNGGCDGTTGCTRPR